MLNNDSLFGIDVTRDINSPELKTNEKTVETSKIRTKQANDISVDYSMDSTRILPERDKNIVRQTDVSDDYQTSQEKEYE